MSCLFLKQKCSKEYSYDFSQLPFSKQIYSLIQAIYIYMYLYEFKRGKFLSSCNSYSNGIHSHNEIKMKPRIKKIKVKCSIIKSKCKNIYDSPRHFSLVSFESFESSMYL